MIPVKCRLAAALCCALCAGSTSINANAQKSHFLGSYDFVEGKGDGLAATVTPEGQFTVGDYDGMRLLRIMPSKTVPVEIKPGQQDPAFPIVNAEQGGKKQEIRVNLMLTDKEARGIDPKQVMSVMVVPEIYDVAYSGNFGSMPARILGHGKGAGDGYAPIFYSGSDWGRMPMTRARLRKRPYMLENVFMDGRAKGGNGADISIQIDDYLLLRSLAVYRVEAEDLALFEERLRDLNQRMIPLLRKRALVEDRADQARTMMAYLDQADGRLCNRAARMRAEILAALESMETATDTFYFDGRLAVARGDRKAVEDAYLGILNQVNAIDRQLSDLDSLAEQIAARAMAGARGKKANWWFAPLRSAPPPMPFTGSKMSPAERILLGGAEGGYSYTHDWRLPYAHSMGVNFRQLWYMYPKLNEDLRSFTAYRSDDERQAAFAQEYMTGLGSSVLTYRHDHIFPIPDWFQKAYEGKTDIWPWNGAGEVKRSLNPFNDEVRKLLVAQHREIARRHRDSPRWNLPLLACEGMQRLAGGGGCENGYDPSAVAKFREYLKGIYGAVTNMNADLGTDYAEFEAVQPPPDMGIKLRRRPGPLDYHFERFRRKCMVDVYEMCANAMKAESPEMRTWFESMAQWDLTAADGIDAYNLFRVAGMGATHAQGEPNP
ncbi:MAG: beta-galactosidase, partial [Kiritimatiellae bacterium]|nr:beta-galactosidase [Kiritimatiellia bacterium]